MSKPCWSNPRTPIININLQLEKVYGSPKRSRPVKIKRGGVDDLAGLHEASGNTTQAGVTYLRPEEAPGEARVGPVGRPH